MMSKYLKYLQLVLDMKKVQYLFLTIFIFIKPLHSQIIKLEKNDSMKLIKIDELKEDGLVFYKNEYSLSLYNKSNIKFNKKMAISHKYLREEWNIVKNVKKKYTILF